MFTGIQIMNGHWHKLKRGVTVKNLEMFNNLYKKDTELAEELKPLKYRLENNPDDKTLNRKVNKLIQERQALKTVMNLYK